MGIVRARLYEQISRPVCGMIVAGVDEFVSRRLFVMPISFVAARIRSIRLLRAEDREETIVRLLAALLVFLALGVSTNKLFVLTFGNGGLLVAPFVEVVIFCAFADDDFAILARTLVDHRHFIDAQAGSGFLALPSLFFHSRF